MGKNEKGAKGCSVESDVGLTGRATHVPPVRLPRKSPSLVEPQERTHTRTHTNVYKHTDIHTCTQTYIHTHTHTPHTHTPGLTTCTGRPAPLLASPELLAGRQPPSAAAVPGSPRSPLSHAALLPSACQAPG